MPLFRRNIVIRLSIAIAIVLVTGTVVSANEWATDPKSGCAVWHGHPNPPAGASLTWSGPCEKGKGAGSGVFVVTVDGVEISRYEGPLRDGKPHGRGHFSTPAGDRYKGDFRNGKFNGQGILTGADGTRYSGDFEDGTMHGKGVFSFPDGRRFEGRFQRGIPISQ